MGTIRKFTGAVLCTAGGALGMLGYRKYTVEPQNALHQMMDAAKKTVSGGQDDSTTLSIVLMAVGVALVLFGMGAVLRKEGK